MNNFNEQTCPITTRWYIRQIIFAVLFLPLTLAILYVADLLSSTPFEPGKLGFVWIIFGLFTLLYGSLGVITIRRGRALRYSFGDTSIHVQTVGGQEYDLAYDHIKEVFVWPRLFGTASLVIEDTSTATTAMSQKGKNFSTRASVDIVGPSGKRVHFPGLRKADAQRLQAFLAEKMR